MKTRIGIHVPTKSRPDRLKTLWESYLLHTEGLSEFVVGIDESERHLYEWVMTPPKYKAESSIKTIIVPDGMDYVAKANYMANYMKGYDYLYLLADDFVINSKFESVFLEAATKNCVYYGRDSYMNEKLPTAAFIDNNINRKLGYIAPPSLIHYFADNIWRDWGSAFDAYKYFDNVNIQHLHRVVDPKYMDKVYGDSEPHFAADQIAYDKYMKEQFNLDIEKLK